MHEVIDESPLPEDMNIPKAFSDVDMKRRRILAVATAAVAALALTACTSHYAMTRHTTKEQSPVASPSESQQAASDLMGQVGDSLIALHGDNQGGWRFQSQIQSPNYQTDRDVGASSVGMGFLVLAQRYPNDSRWLDAAKSTASWLTVVSKQDATGGRYWPDFVNDGGDISGSNYTSFDDGAIGIGDFYWQLYDTTHDDQYKTIALQSVQWTLSQAQNVGTSSQPVYRWIWDVNDSKSGYNMGMGMGQVGIINTLTTFYQRTKDSDPMVAAQYKSYIDGALRYMNTVQNNLGNAIGDSRYAQALPETGVIGQDGDTTMNSGYLSGAAGAAYMYLHLYQVFGDQAYKQQADATLSWLNNTDYGPKVDLGNGAAAWKLAVDPQGNDDGHYATGVEEGAAGIGWTYLQAYYITHNTAYLDTAKQAGSWLLKAGNTDKNSGMSWPEDQGSPIVHPNLNNGAAGIGTFLADLYSATKDTKYLAGAQGAQKWLTATAVHSGNTVYWNDNDGGTPFSKDPSWHWGDAGVVAFLSRMSGGNTDMPGEESALVSSY